MAEVLLDVQSMTKRFGGLVAVSHVDLQIDNGKIVSLIGPNGAGKTTFFNCVTGFYGPDEGDIVFDGRSIAGLSTDQIAQRGIARTYQNIRLFGPLTVLENVLVGMHTHLKSGLLGAVLGLPRTRQEERAALLQAAELLEFVGLEEVGDYLAENLPYGFQRRLEIARALAIRPRLLLLDEPTAGMNPHETEEMMIFIRRLRDELNLTIFLIEHDMRVVMGISDRVTVMDYGRKIAEGTPAEVQRDPEVIRAYLGTGSQADEVIDEVMAAQDENVEVES
jgi:branched-chain amino acid transport system ATP-binding protein